MNEKKTGGPAFPVIPPANEHGHSPSGYPYPDEGMTLRDYFAAHAIAGMCANPHASQVADDGGFSIVDVRKSFADSAYAVADAMLAARDQ